MFEPQESEPWYRSVTGLIAASVVLPPLGLAMLWIRRDAATSKKILGTLGILLLGVGYVFLFSTWRRSGANEAVYDAVERDRAQQEASGVAATTGQPTTPANAAQLPANAASPVAAGSASAVPAGAPETAAAHASRN